MQSQQAQRIVEKFGGARRLAEAISYQPSAVYKWTYPKEKGGTDGFVPNGVVVDIVKAADLLGIELTSDDWRP